MWEFSLNLDNREPADMLFNSIKDLTTKLGGIVTSTCENGHTSIIIGMDESKREIGRAHV